jgi:regulator of replication initiation timing
MKTKLISILISLACIVGIVVAGLSFPEQRATLAAERAAFAQNTEQAKKQLNEMREQNAALEQTSAEARQRMAQLREEKAMAEKSAALAAEQTQSLNNAVDASKAFQQQQFERSKRGRAMNEGFIAAQGVKVAMTDYFQSEGRWPANNAALGLTAPESYRTEILRSVNAETFGKSGRVRVRFVDEGGSERELHLIANVNGAMQVSWQCVSPDVRDIAEIAPSCKFVAG